MEAQAEETETPLRFRGIEISKILESVQSFHNHMSYGNAWKLYHRVMDNYVLTKGSAASAESPLQTHAESREQQNIPATGQRESGSGFSLPSI